DTFNAAVPHVPSTATSSVRCEITLPPGQQTEGYRYMYENMTEKTDTIDDRIDRFAGLLTDTIRPTLPATEQEDFELTHAGYPSQEPTVAVGRIACDSIEEGSKLNDMSILLESSRAGGGSRVKLNIKDMQESGVPFSFFPGQIVAVHGVNPSGRSFNVAKVTCPAIPPSATTAASHLLALYPPDDPVSRTPINIIVAAGPYTLDSNLSFEPLEALVTDVVEVEKPDVIILVGPFVDAAHPLIAAGEVNQDLDTLFRNEIATRLERMRGARQGTHVVLVPSTRDAISDWCAFPQPPLAAASTPDLARARRTALNLAPSILLVPNPVQLAINEVVVAISAAEFAFHAQGQLVVSRPGQQHPRVDRIAQLHRHILEQRSFYPLVPPALDDACIDSAHLGALELQARPDILIAPSRLKRSVKVVDGCVCLNPGRLASAAAGGTFAKICLHPLDIEAI
ncbi:DNA polymerase alpha/epsilon subunit B-domain-containing protein, partial [Blyttiomyces helicus]